MAISLIATKATDGWTSASSTPALTNHTTTTGTEKVIVAVISFYTESGATVSAYSFDSVAGARVTSTNTVVSGLGVDIWIVKLASHTGASKAQSLTLSANAESGTVTLYEVNGVDQTTPGLHGVTSTGSGSPTLSVLTVASGEFSIDGFTSFGGASNGVPGGSGTHTEVRNELTGGGLAVYSGYNADSSGTVIMSWANDTGTFVQGAMSLAVAAGAADPEGSQIIGKLVGRGMLLDGILIQ